MWIVWLFIFLQSSLVYSRYYLYNTYLSSSESLDKYDCLYVTDDEMAANSRLEYCRRPFKKIVRQKYDDCLTSYPQEFIYLKKTNETSESLMMESVPIDLVDAYMLYLETGEGEDKYICYCTGFGQKRFGAVCEYQFSYETSPIYHPDGYSNYWSYMLDLLDEGIHETAVLQAKVTNGTCYIDLPGCVSLANICLHWNQICDGQIDCADGTDELDCLTLELNQCNYEMEYRCRQGSCIPLQAASNYISDCIDASDEYRFSDANDGLSSNSYCDVRDFPFCYDHFCGANGFACGDGTCSYDVWRTPQCLSQRDLHYVRSILSTSMTDDDSCWTFAICELGFEHFFSHLIPWVCVTSTCKKAMFFFPSEHFIAHPSVQFIYKTDRDFSNELIHPDYVCFDAFICKNYHLPTVTILNRTCSMWIEITNLTYSIYEWSALIFTIRQIFAICYLPNKEMLDQNLLFDCGHSFWISKHRLNDDYVDCAFFHDEMKDRNVCQLNLANRFQCKTSKTECIPRLFLSDDIEDCTDGSDENVFYTCRSTTFEAGCKWKQGSLEALSTFEFARLCDGFVDYIIDNITDEENCLSSWIHSCNSSSIRCDGQWHCRDGHDELNCPSNLFNPCKNNQVPFSCINRTSGKWICYSSDLAGDGHEDCIGAIDERVQGYCHINYSTDKQKRFRCGNSSTCLTIYELCNGVRDCPIGINDDETTLCPWILTIVEEEEESRTSSFICRNSTIVERYDRCDGKRDCADAEDELFCNLSDPEWDYYHYNEFLIDINVYPPSSVVSSLSIKQNNINGLSKSQRIYQSKAILKSNENLIYSTWYCNRGLIAYDELHAKNVCFCPSALYGERCEFQRRRVTIIIQMDNSDQYLNDVIPIKLVFYLIKTEDFDIVDYQDRIIIPQQLQTRASNEMNNHLYISLLFPILRNETSKNVKHFVKIDAFLINNTSLDFQASWYFNLSFSFLPVQRIVANLIFTKKLTTNVGICSHRGNRIPYINTNTNWCYCKEGWSGTNCDRPDTICHPNPCFSGSICISIQGKPVCLCSLNRYGPTCRVRMTYSCDKVYPCQNNGTCFVIDPDGRFLTETVYCACPLGFTGTKCEKEAARLNIQFDSQLIKQYSSVSAMIVRLTTIEKNTQSYDTYRRLFKHIELPTSLPTIYRDRQKHHFDFSFIQLFTKADHIYGQYYLIMSNNTLSSEKKEVDLAMHINTTVLLRNHCPYIDQLFSETIVKLASLQRAKYYQEPCQKNFELTCFHDEQFMCICNRLHITQCFIFNHQYMNCSTRYSCINQGLCLQENEILNPLDYICICKECFFGDLCQFTTSQYTISLDALIGLMIIKDKPLQQQTFVIQLCFAIIFILLVFGVCLNSIAIILFIFQKTCRLSGSGLYIIVLSILGIFCLIILMLKFIALVLVSHLSTKLGCILLDYFLKILPAMVDWINVCVLLERVWAVQNGVKFDKMKSIKIAKITIPSLMLLIILSLIHDPLHRESVTDPRLDITRQPWCVVRFDTDFIRIYNMIISLIHFVIPFVINIISALFIFKKLANIKSKAKQQAYNLVLKEQILAFKHLIISPIILIILAIPRLVFAIIFTCLSTSSTWQIYVLLFGYFISFFPQIGTFLTFILPSKTYKNELTIFISKIHRYTRKT